MQKKVKIANKQFWGEMAETHAVTKTAQKARPVRILFHKDELPRSDRGWSCRVCLKDWALVLLPTLKCNVVKI